MNQADDAPTRISMLDLLRRRAADDDAIVGEDGAVSFGELIERVDRMMGLVRRQGWTPGSVVGISIQDAQLHVTSSLALLCLGAPQVGLPSYEPPSSNRSTADRLGVSLVLCEAPAVWMDGLAPVVVTERALRAAPRGVDAARWVSAGDVAIYIKTSGSTTVPKLFEMSFARIVSSADRYAADPAERRAMRTSSTEFDSTRVYRLFRLLGGCATVLPPRDMSALGSVCARLDVSRVHIGVYLLSSMLNDGAQVSRLPSATSIMTSGSRVPGPLRARVADRLSDNLFVSYATSEVGPISTATPDQHAAFPEGVGFPRPDTMVEIVDDDGRHVEPGEIGQIRVRRPAAPTAYVGQEAHAAQFRQDWFYPNDLVSWAEGSPLIHHGRADDVMMLSGVKIPGGAIEDALLAVRGVREAVAFALPSRLYGEVPAAAVVLSESAELRAPAELLAHCRRIMGIRAPRRIVVLDAIPRTPTGKPLRRELSRL